jgi:hypothetical protein
MVKVDRMVLKEVLQRCYFILISRDQKGESQSIESNYRINNSSISFCKSPRYSTTIDQII